MYGQECEPFTEDMVLEEKQVNAWLKHFGLYPMQKAHASGHAFEDESKWIVEEVSPKRVYPVHTEHPEMFKIWSEGAEMVEMGRKYAI